MPRERLSGDIILNNNNKKLYCVLRRRWLSISHHVADASTSTVLISVHEKSSKFVKTSSPFIAKVSLISRDHLRDDRTLSMLAGTTPTFTALSGL